MVNNIVCLCLRQQCIMYMMKKSFFFFLETVRTPNLDGLAALICLLYNGKYSLRETKRIFVSRFRGLQACTELVFFFFFFLPNSSGVVLRL